MKIVLKHSNESGKIPTIDDLIVGEVALNVSDGKMYSKSIDTATGQEYIFQVSENWEAEHKSPIKTPSIIANNPDNFKGPIYLTAYKTDENFTGKMDYAEFQISYDVNFTSYESYISNEPWAPLFAVNPGETFYVRARYVSGNQASDWAYKRLVASSDLAPKLKIKVNGKFQVIDNIYYLKKDVSLTCLPATDDGVLPPQITWALIDENGNVIEKITQDTDYYDTIYLNSLCSECEFGDRIYISVYENNEYSEIISNTITVNLIKYEMDEIDSASTYFANEIDEIHLTHDRYQISINDSEREHYYIESDDERSLIELKPVGSTDCSNVSGNPCSTNTFQIRILNIDTIKTVTIKAYIKNKEEKIISNISYKTISLHPENISADSIIDVENKIELINTNFNNDKVEIKLKDFLQQNYKLNLTLHSHKKIIYSAQKNSDNLVKGTYLTDHLIYKYPFLNSKEKIHGLFLKHRNNAYINPDINVECDLVSEQTNEAYTIDNIGFTPETKFLYVKSSTSDKGYLYYRGTAGFLTKKNLDNGDETSYTCLNNSSRPILGNYVNFDDDVILASNGSNLYIVKLSEDAVKATVTTQLDSNIYPENAAFMFKNLINNYFYVFYLKSDGLVYYKAYDENFNVTINEVANEVYADGDTTNRHRVAAISYIKSLYYFAVNSSTISFWALTQKSDKSEPTQIRPLISSYSSSDDTFDVPHTRYKVSYQYNYDWDNAIFHNREMLCSSYTKDFEELHETVLLFNAIDEKGVGVFKGESNGYGTGYESVTLQIYNDLLPESAIRIDANAYRLKNDFYFDTFVMCGTLSNPSHSRNCILSLYKNKRYDTYYSDHDNSYENGRHGLIALTYKNGGYATPIADRFGIVDTSNATFYSRTLGIAYSTPADFDIENNAFFTKSALFVTTNLNDNFIYSDYSVSKKDGSDLIIYVRKNLNNVSIIADNSEVEFNKRTFLLDRNRFAVAQILYSGYTYMNILPHNLEINEHNYISLIAGGADPKVQIFDITQDRIIAEMNYTADDIEASHYTNKWTFIDDDSQKIIIMKKSGVIIYDIVSNTFNNIDDTRFESDRTDILGKIDNYYIVSAYDYSNENIAIYKIDDTSFEITDFASISNVKRYIFDIAIKNNTKEVFAFYSNSSDNDTIYRIRFNESGSQIENVQAHDLGPKFDSRNDLTMMINNNFITMIVNSFRHHKSSYQHAMIRKSYKYSDFSFYSDGDDTSTYKNIFGFSYDDVSNAIAFVSGHNYVSHMSGDDVISYTVPASIDKIYNGYFVSNHAGFNAIYFYKSIILGGYKLNENDYEDIIIYENNTEEVQKLITKDLLSTETEETDDYLITEFGNIVIPDANDVKMFMVNRGVFYDSIDNQVIVYK